ncbi:MAG: response regulator transcription factor [Spirochaetaceae bacterium]|nr:response regulator transcription factor [Spirochaetaceae bacterium]
MTVCVVADSEPYLHYRTESDPDGTLSVFVCAPPASGPSGGETWPRRAELYVLPAALLLGLPPEARPRPNFAYGQDRLMAAAFNAGAGDYLREPWSMAELRARAGRLRDRRFRLGERRFRLEGRRLGVEEADPGEAILLSDAESRLLVLLAQNPREAVPREALELALWGELRPHSRTLDVLVSSLRRKMRPCLPDSESPIIALRRQGYRLCALPVDKS